MNTTFETVSQFVIFFRTSLYVGEVTSQ